MPFIGNQPSLSYTSFAKQDFTTSATTSYTLNNPVANENEIALFINFVRQEPTTAYTASGTTLTLTSATSASDDMYCVFLGKAVQTVTPASGSVTNDMISYPLAKSGATVSTFNRTTSDGDILELQKDGTTVGSIGVKDSAFLYLGNGDTGLKFTNTTDAITPADGSNGTGRNNAIDLGNTSNGFKDLYLGGGLYVGGTAAANKLDDYEEGTWTPSVGGTATYSVQRGVYRKIGKTVIAPFQLQISSIGTGSPDTVSGLPFTSTNDTNLNIQSGYVCYFANLALSAGSLAFYVENNATTFVMTSVTGDSTTTNNAPNVIGSNTQIYGTAIYVTDS